jgi:tripartite ATP-independent transporter DctP family solute receptor
MSIFSRGKFLLAMFLILVQAAQAQTAPASPTAATAPTVLRAWNAHPDGYPVTEAMKSFAEQVAKETDGRYRIEVFSNAALGDQPKAVKMLKDGEIDAAVFSSGPLSDAVPSIKVLNLPFLFSDSAHMFKHLDGKLGEKFSLNLAKAGFNMLGWYDGGARSFYCADKSIKSIRDLEGLRIRVLPSEVFQEMVKSLDAKPVTVPFKDVKEALAAKTIDCAENNMPSYDSTGHAQLAKHVLLTNHVYSAEALVVSSKLWQKLSPKDQEVFRNAGAKSAILMRDLWKKRVLQAIESTTKQGSQFVRVKDSAPMVKRLGPLYTKYMTDPVTRQELLTIIAN